MLRIHLLRQQKVIRWQSRAEGLPQEIPHQAETHVRNQDPPLRAPHEHRSFRALLRGLRQRIHPAGNVQQPVPKRDDSAEKAAYRARGAVLHGAVGRCFEVPAGALHRTQGFEAGEYVPVGEDGNQTWGLRPGDQGGLRRGENNFL